MSERRPAVIHRVVLAVLTVFLCGGVARASDISFLCASALQGSMQTLLPEFEAASGHHVTVQYGNIGTNTERVRRGDAADLAIVSPAQFDSLQKDGKVSSSVSAVIGKTGFAVSVKKGASRPDIGTVEAFKQVLLAARSIAIGDPSGGAPAGVYTMQLLDRLGISAEIKPKLQIVPPGPGNIIADAITKGGAEFGIDPTPLILSSPDVDLVGQFPPEAQSFTIYVAAIPTAATQAEAARALVTFLTSARGVSVLKAKGFEPG